MVRTSTPRLALIAASTALVLAPASAALAAPADPGAQPAPTAASGSVTHVDGTMQDLAGVPAVFSVRDETLANTNFRTAAWTGTDLQLTLMSIPVGGDVGLEIHHDTDQFFRVEAGQGQFQAGTEESLDFVKDVREGDIILIPMDTWHNIVNTGDEPLQLYSIYGPAHHPVGTVHPLQSDDPHSDDAHSLPTPAIGDVLERGEWVEDPGHVPYVGSMTEGVQDNDNYRLAVWTGELLQVTVMDIPVGGDIGNEMHTELDQFLRVESGSAEVYFGETEDGLELAAKAGPGDAILVPGGTWHNVVNAGEEPLKLYSVYGPAAHPRGTVHATKMDDPHWSEDPGSDTAKGDIPVTAQIPGTDGDDDNGDDNGVPGSLVLSIADGDLTLGDARNAGDRLRLTGVLPSVTVTDSRAGEAGWTVTGQSSDLRDDAATVRASHLGWEPFVVDGAALPGDLVATDLAGGSGLAAPATLGTGVENGATSLAADVHLEVPVDTKAGSYTGGMTISLFPQD